MLHPVFDRLFGKLLRRWHRYQGAPRDPERVTELASARADLDDTRAEVADARAEHHPDEERLSPEPPRQVAIDDEEYQRLRLRGVYPEG